METEQDQVTVTGGLWQVMREAAIAPDQREAEANLTWVRVLDVFPSWMHLEKNKIDSYPAKN